QLVAAIVEATLDGGVPARAAHGPLGGVGEALLHGVAVHVVLVAYDRVPVLVEHRPTRRIGVTDLDRAGELVVGRPLDGPAVVVEPRLALLVEALPLRIVAPVVPRPLDDGAPAAGRGRLAVDAEVHGPHVVPVLVLGREPARDAIGGDDGAAV